MKNILYLLICSVTYLLQSCIPQPVGSVEVLITTADRSKDFAYEIIPLSEESEAGKDAKVVSLDSVVRY